MTKIKLYSVSDGPPSLAVRMALEYLQVPFQLIEVDYANGEFLTEDYAKLNPQKEIPVLDDDNFLLSESVAILQYLCDKYSRDETFYPKEYKKRATVNHRLIYNMASYYQAISQYVMAPIFFDYQRTELAKKKVDIALETFNIILERSGTTFSCDDHLTVGDLGLIASTLCLEAINYKFTKYNRINRWYNLFKEKFPILWKIAENGMIEIRDFNNNPPHLPNLKHPIHPTRK